MLENVNNLIGSEQFDVFLLYEGINRNPHTQTLMVCDVIRDNPG